MRQILVNTLLPLLSLSIVMMGNTFFTTFFSLQLNARGTDNFVIGLISACYGLGFLLGALFNERMITHVGHIRSFAIFAASLTFLVLLQAIYQAPWFWTILRLLSGVCVAGIYLVVESWLLVLSDITQRGKALALYMVALYMAQSSSQILINGVELSTHDPFIWAALFCCLSVIPVSLKRVDCPMTESPSLLSLKKTYKISPLGFVACFFSGLIIGPMYSLLPIQAQDIGLDLSNIAHLMTIVILGALLLQWPIGHASDSMRRTSVLIVVVLLTAGLSLLLALFASSMPYLLLLATIFVFGGLVFCVYPLSVAITCDYLDAKDLIAGTGVLLVLYSLGATIGPILAPAIMNMNPKGGFFLYTFASCVFMVFYALYRRVKRTPLEPSEQTDFVLVPQTSIHVGELDPRSE